MYPKRSDNQTDTAAGTKANNRKRKLNKSFIVLLSVVLLVSIAAGATIAYLISEGGAVTNSFVPGKVDCLVNNDYSVSLTEDTNTPAYVRVAVIATWQKDGVVFANADDSIGFELTTGSAWTQHDGYYYYEVALDPKETPVTAPLTNGFTYNGNASGIPEGYSLCVEILAEAIQANGTTDGDNQFSYRDSWAAAVYGG